ncbi:hypothetical protein BDY24DRAFT_363337 [Mrakia frigida]|uniref:cysteine and histidine-rich domain-containing protein n=1 Tax=Mrakia frigida TaxID=29902 RepID=UPI003FCC1090
MSTITCGRQGCNSTYSPDSNPEGSCSYHPGAPFFHEGLKSWSCCKDINKPVMEFDQFVKLPGCTKSSHIPKASAPPPLPSTSTPASSSSAPTTISSSGKETYGSAPPPKPAAPSAPTAIAAAAPVVPKEIIEEQDEPGMEIPEGAKCKRRGCGVQVGSEKEECVYHPGAPIFREGSKGYTCCKRRVLEFDEFLRIEGCKTSKHLFVGAKKVGTDPDSTIERELISSRTDFYQTPSQVHVSIFAKGCDKETSKVVIEENEVHLDLNLPQNKRTLRTLALFGPIDPSKSSFSILGTKVSLTLQKSNGLSWALLEIPEGGKESLPAGYGTVFAPGTH